MEFPSVSNFGSRGSVRLRASGPFPLPVMLSDSRPIDGLAGRDLIHRYLERDVGFAAPHVQERIQASKWSGIWVVWILRSAGHTSMHDDERLLAGATQRSCEKARTRRLPACPAPKSSGAALSGTRCWLADSARAKNRSG